MTVPALGPPTASTAARLRDGRRRRRPRRRLELRPTRSRAPPACCARTARRPTTARAIFAYNHAELVRRSGAREGGRVPRRVRARARRAALAPRSPGRSRTSAASRTASGRRPIAAARCRTCRRASRRARRATARCSSRWAMAQAGIDVGLTTVHAVDRRTDCSRTARRQLRPRSSSRGVGPNPPSGGYRPGDIIFFGHGARRRRPRRALARQRPDRPVLVERRRLEHPAARRLRRADGLGPLADVTG